MRGQRVVLKRIIAAVLAFGLAAGDLRAYTVPDGAGTHVFHEPFVWKGNHQATLQGGAATSVSWNPDDWDVRADSGAQSHGGIHSIDIRRANPSLFDGKPNSAYAVGGDGSQGVGHIFAGKSMSMARLRNPLLISDTTPGVVEFMADLFGEDGHWLEFIITPADGSIIQGDTTALPGAPGYPFPSPSINVASGRGNFFPCDFGWWTDVVLSMSPGSTYTEQVEHQRNEQLRIFAGPETLNQLVRWRLEYYRTHVIVKVDVNRNGVFENDATETGQLNYEVPVPWTEVHFHFLSAVYGPDHHPAPPCNIGMTRDLHIKDVRAYPVKYGRVEVWPKNQGTNRVPKNTGWMFEDMSDSHNLGMGVNGIPQLNIESGLYPGDVKIMCRGEAVGCGDPARYPASRELQVHLPNSLAGLERAQFVYDSQSNANLSTVQVNDGPGIPLPSMPTVPTFHHDQDNSTGGGGQFSWPQRSVNLPLSGPGSLRQGDNTLRINLHDPSTFERMHLELYFRDRLLLVGPPAAPDGLSAAAIHGRRIDVAWDDNSSDESGFRVLRSSPGMPYQSVALVGANQESYQDLDVSPSTGYSYKVLAFNDAGDSGESAAAATATPGTDPVIPVAPTGFTAVSRSPGHVTLTWVHTSDDEDGFIIEANNRPSDPTDWVRVMTTGPNVNTFTHRIGDWGADGPVGYRVRAFNAAGMSAASNEVVTTLVEHQAGTPPPPELSILGASPTSVTVAWTPVMPATNFNLDMAEEGGGWTLVGDYLVITQSPYVVTGLSPSKRYSFRIEAINSAGALGTFFSGHSVSTSTVTAAPPVAPPSNPGNLRVTGVTANSISLAWDDNSNNEDGFKVERSIENGPYVELPDIFGPGVKTFTNVGLPTGIGFSYRVRSFTVTHGFSTSYSNAAGAITGSTPPPNPGPGPGPGPGPSGAGEDPSARNPERLLTPGTDGCNDDLVFSLEDEHLEVLNANGRVVFNASRTGGALSWNGRGRDGRALPSGVYIARLKSSAGATRIQRILLAK